MSASATGLDAVDTDTPVPCELMEYPGRYGRVLDAFESLPATPKLHAGIVPAACRSAPQSAGCMLPQAPCTGWSGARIAHAVLCATYSQPFCRALRKASMRLPAPSLPIASDR
ncbi:MAG: hypothetical protein AMXMBFR25_13710 [Lysobacterales bacterium]